MSVASRPFQPTCYWRNMCDFGSEDHVIEPNDIQRYVS